MTQRNIVASQSMYFPWVGLLEQIRLADVFVHYDDVRLTRGFYNRVQIKTPQGQQWLTVPLEKHARDTRIDEAKLDARQDWRGKHRALLQQAYGKAPFRDEMLGLVDRVFNTPATTLADLARNSITTLADYFELSSGTQFMDSKSLNVGGASSQRLHDIVLALRGNVYITGHGARNYLDHELFERSGVAVQYMRYELTPYPQLHGEFTPYVTALDLVANCGKDGSDMIRSEAIDWKIFRGIGNE